MTSDRKMPFYIVLFACVLVVLGDLRNAITPLGYWVLWGVILFVGAFTASVKKIQYDAAFFSVSCGFAILIFAIFIAGIVNGDVTTAYQGLKYVIIYAILIVVYSNSQYLQLNQFYTVSAISTLVGLLVFLFSKYIISDYFIILGDGRQGSLVAFPGVLWKTNAFFVAFIIARMLSNPTRNLIPTVFVFLSSVYLLLADSSRTGFLWFAVIVAAFALLVFVANTARFLSVSSVLVLLVGVISVFNLDAIYGFVDSNSLLVVNRLFEGDPIRAKMITDGIVNADACLPLGCGFQTSTSIVDGAPMVIHNVYLAILGDYGALGELGLLIIVVSPVIVFVMREWTSGSTKTPLVFYKLAAYLGAACYCFILLFHPLSSEMSEWGYWAIMLSWLSRLSNEKQATNITSDLRARF
jgi:O-antigen ligase